MFHKNTSKHPQNVLYETEQWHTWNNTLAGEDTDTQTQDTQNTDTQIKYTQNSDTQTQDRQNTDAQAQEN